MNEEEQGLIEEHLHHKNLIIGLLNERKNIKCVKEAEYILVELRNQLIKHLTFLEKANYVTKENRIIILNGLEAIGEMINFICPLIYKKES